MGTAHVWFAGSVRGRYFEPRPPPAFGAGG